MDENEFEIDVTQLDIAWLKQPKLYFKYATELANAKAEVDRLKSQVDVTEAEVHLAVLSKPEKYGLEKTTDAVVKQAVIVQMDKKSVAKKLRLARHHVDTLQAFVNALDQKKRALESLVSLHGMQYFSTPKASDEDSRKYVEDMKDRRVFQHKSKKGK